MVASNDSHKYASHSGERYLHLHHHYAAASSSDDLHATSSSLLCRSMIIRTAVEYNSKVLLAIALALRIAALAACSIGRNGASLHTADAIYLFGKVLMAGGHSLCGIDLVLVCWSGNGVVAMMLLVAGRRCDGFVGLGDYCIFARSSIRNGNSDGGCRGDIGGWDKMGLNACDQLFG
ncbi:Hypothetical predicted protein [Olea europaea subsp. europaea]|uniref:Uncharacterized protein n=1 Tax=Olea europaea subsp. europaea TaxID=158383 RepID=A0A8S0P8J2_OLEEU|nr:Hypothetical predicted protein [Olea europaea subsp. europaea]